MNRSRSQNLETRTILRVGVEMKDDEKKYIVYNRFKIFECLNLCKERFMNKEKPRKLKWIYMEPLNNNEG